MPDGSSSPDIATQQPNPEITAEIPASFKVRDVLKGKGYIPGDFEGHVDARRMETPQRYVGIVLPPKDVKTGIRGYFSDATNRFFGRVDLFNDLKDDPNIADAAVKNADWILRVYGRVNLEAAQTLATDISAETQKKVGVYLTSEQEKSTLQPWKHTRVK